MSNFSLKEQLKELQKQFSSELEKKLLDIESSWQELLESNDDDSLKNFQRKLHNLGGSSANFGFPALGETARQLDTYLLEIIKNKTSLTSEHQKKITPLLKQLKKESQEYDAKVFEETLNLDLDLEADAPPVSPLVYIVEDEVTFAKQLALQLGQLGYSLQIFSKLSELKEALKLNSPKAIILDIIFPEGELAGPQVIAEIRQEHQISCPIIFLSSRDDLDARLEAIRASGDAYFTKPVDIKLLSEKLNSLVSIGKAGGYRVLIVDDEVTLSNYYEKALQSGGLTTKVVNNPLETMEVLVDFKADLILLDIYMPNCNGFELAQVIRQQEEFAEIPIVFLSMESRPNLQFEALRIGGDDFLNKPIQANQLVSVIKSRLKRTEQIQKSVSQKNSYPYASEQKKATPFLFSDLGSLLETERKVVLLEEAGEPSPFSEIIGKSGPMQEVFRRLKLAAQSDVTVLITGESGTGKELVARAIHSSCERKKNPFLALNCAALSETLLESELFGHVKGSFTGAIKDKVGLFQASSNGILFLDEIGDISPYLQLKLLRVIQEREIRRVGDENSIKINSRLITATHRNLKELISVGNFREDFYYRIRVFEITLPPLRERKEDIPVLINHFISKFSEPFKKKIIAITDEAMRKMTEYSWPGNVRELQNAIEHAFVSVQSDRITLLDLPVEVRDPQQSESPSSLKRPLTLEEENERERIKDALQKTQGNRTKASKLLGFSRVTLWKKIQKFEIES